MVADVLENICDRNFQSAIIKSSSARDCRERGEFIRSQALPSNTDVLALPRIFMEPREEARLAEQSARLAEQQGRLAAESAFQQSEKARLATELSLRAVVSHLLNSGTNLEQVAKMMNLSISEVERLVGRSE